MIREDEIRDWRNMAWDDRLISRHRAADMSGTWGLKVDDNADGDVFFRCTQCDQNVLKLPSAGKGINVDGIMSAVIRHMVMSKHGYTLSGGKGNGSAG